MAVNIKTVDVYEDQINRDGTPIIIDEDGNARRITVSVSIEQPVGGTIKIGKSTSSYGTTDLEVYYGNIIYYTITVNSGYTFNKVIVNQGSDAYYTTKTGSFTVKSDTTISADLSLNKVTKYTITGGIQEINGVAKGIVYLSSSPTGTKKTSYSASSGETVYVTCEPYSDYSFLSWSAPNAKSTSGTASSSEGYIVVDIYNVTVTAAFKSIWTYDDDSNTWTCNGDTNNPYNTSFISAKKIVVESGKEGKVVLKSSTERDYDGIFLATDIPENWNGNFKSNINNIYLYNSNSYVTGVNYPSTTSYTPNVVEINDIPEGTYYVVARWDGSEKEYDNYVSFQFTQSDIVNWEWENEYRVCDLQDKDRTNGILIYEQIRYKKDNSDVIGIPNGYSGTIIMSSYDVLEEYSGIFLSQKDTIPVQFDGEFSNNTDLFYSSDAFTAHEGDSVEINDIPSGTYYAAYRSIDDTSVVNEKVSYKLTVYPNDYELVFISNGGTLRGLNWGENEGTTNNPYVIVTMDSSNYSIMGYCEKEGYTFNGWYSSNTGGVQVYDSTGRAVVCDDGYWDKNKCWKNTQDTIVYVYARYTPNSYTIKYDPNCSDIYGNPMSSDSCIYDCEYILQTNIYSRPGFEFIGWSTSSNSTEIEYYDEEFVSNLTPENNATVVLYAVWKAEESYDDNRDIGLINDYNSMSVNRIKSILNNDDNVDYLRDLETSEYKIKILDPDSVETLDIFSVTPIMETDKNIISTVDVNLKSDTNNLNLKIINRYSGYYNPIFKDILFYNDYEGKPFSNTSFDEDYEDNYGKFGFIKNMWFHKVNNEKTGILGTDTACYPLTGKYALDFKDYNIFSSSWDKGYFTKQTDINHSESCDSIGSMKEKLCMFGSKYLNVPETIIIEEFTDGGDWNDDYITNSIGCPGEVMYKEVNDNSVDFYFFLHKRIVRYFLDILKDEFEKYINKNYSYGKTDTLDDDIEEYVEKNILKLYELKKIGVYVKRIKKGISNSQIENDYGSYLDKTVDTLKSDGFVEINTVSLSKINTDNFDRKLTYNLRNNEQEYFGFRVIINKI